MLLLGVLTRPFCGEVWDSVFVLQLPRLVHREPCRVRVVRYRAVGLSDHAEAAVLPVRVAVVAAVLRYGGGVAA